MWALITNKNIYVNYNCSDSIDPLVARGSGRVYCGKFHPYTLSNCDRYVPYSNYSRPKSYSIISIL